MINRGILHKRLTVDGHDVTSICNGQQCVELLEKDQDFDCILMDIQCVQCKFSRKIVDCT